MCVFLQYFDTVGWVFWPVKTVSRITYTVLAGTLNTAHSLTLVVKLKIFQFWYESVYFFPRYLQNNPCLVYWHLYVVPLWAMLMVLWLLHVKVACTLCCYERCWWCCGYLMWRWLVHCAAMSDADGVMVTSCEGGLFVHVWASSISWSAAANVAAWRFLAESSHSQRSQRWDCITWCLPLIYVDDII